MSDKDKKKDEVGTEGAKTSVAPVLSTMSQDVKDAIALSTAMVAEALKAHSQTRVDPKKGYDGPRCAECGQYQIACGSKHRQVVVWPHDRHFAKYFQGIRINGVTYLSNGPHHRVTVPAESDIENMVFKWTENEQEIAQGRVAEHHSGSVEKFQPAYKAWR